MSETKEPSVLYTAATESLVSDASATSTYEKMIAVGYTHAVPETFKEELKATETQIRKDFDISSMPSPWRSAKSVILTAMTLKIPMVDDNGTYIGKSALQSKIKALKAEKEPVTSNEYADAIIRKLVNIPEGLDTKTVLITVRDYLNSLTI
jgi:hypothetical protein